MAEIQEGQINGGGGGALVVATSENFSSKRQRRPSVRLGDIDDTHVRRNHKQWKFPKDSSNNNSSSGKGSKTRTLMNLGGGSSTGTDFLETPDAHNNIINNNDHHKDDSTDNTINNVSNLDTVAIGSWRVKDLKSKRGLATKKVRSNWVSKVDGNEGVGEKYCEDFDDNDDGRGFRDLEHEGSESPIHSLENRRQVRGRGLSEGHDGIELSGDTDWRCGDGNGDCGRMCHEDGGVRSWLEGLGLGRYAPVFEIHEVDDEVLPLLTLDDLKDMGINAVGSRRKMFCAIQKLGKGFS